MHVLYEDNHLLVVVKPAGLATMGVAPDKPSLLTEARQYIKRKYQKPGNVYLGVVSRLDAPVTGVVLLARTSKAAARLTEQFKNRSVEKTYWALVEGSLSPDNGRLVDWIGPDERHRRMHLVTSTTADAREARLGYRTLRHFNQLSLVEITLETGRKHQIRLQLAGAGCPIVGDRKYGSRRTFAAGIALHARRLVFEHPVKREMRIELVAQLPAAWRKSGVPEPLPEGLPPGPRE
jgi:23S rRNA pseudouridine1911/1915/1917 synthase